MTEFTLIHEKNVGAQNIDKQEIQYGPEDWICLWQVGNLIVGKGPD